MTQKAMTVASLAAHWGVSDTFVYSLIKAGELEAFRLGGKLIRIRPEAVEAYEARTATTETDEAPDEPHVAELRRPDPAHLGRLIRGPARSST